jgi:hypothetical protein
LDIAVRKRAPAIPAVSENFFVDDLMRPRQILLSVPFRLTESP